MAGSLENKANLNSSFGWSWSWSWAWQKWNYHRSMNKRFKETKVICLLFYSNLYNLKGYLTRLMAEHGDKSAFLSHGLVIHGYQSAPLTAWFWQPIFCHPPITGITPHITTGLVTIVHSTNNVRKGLKTSRGWANSNRTGISQMSCWNKRYSN